MAATAIARKNMPARKKRTDPAENTNIVTSSLPRDNLVSRLCWLDFGINSGCILRVCDKKKISAKGASLADPGSSIY